jgi:hypothetical protein
MKLAEVYQKYDSTTDFLLTLKNEVVKLAEGKPKFKYTTESYAGCFYNKRATKNGIYTGPDCKGCILGQALQNMGWTDDEEMNSSATINVLLKRYIKSVDFSEFNIVLELQTVQSQQDHTASWGEAIKSFT